MLERLKYSDPTYYVLLKHWPATVLLPCVVLLLAALILITKWWDLRDAEAAQERSRRANLGEGPLTAGPAGS